MVIHATAMTETSPKAALDRIAAALVHVRETAKGGTIVTPVLFPSGAHVSVRVVLESDHCLITDDGAAFAEADMMGAVDIFKRAGRTVAEEAGIRFNSYEIFEAHASLETAPGIVAIIADAARRTIQITAERLAKRLYDETRVDVVDRLIDAFGPHSVRRDAAISGASTHDWSVDAFIDIGPGAAVEVISPAPVSVSSSYMKLDDIRRLENAPRTVGALTSRRAFKADQLLILGRTAKLIEARSPMDELRRLVA